MRRLVRPANLLAALVCAIAAFAAAASARDSGRAFYLTLHPRQCTIFTNVGGKSIQVVPCSDPSHNAEVYAIGHGGWGHNTPPSQSRAYGIARSFCLGAFQRLTGHPLPSSRGWWAFWPDAGAETAQYGDKIICSYRAWPRLLPLGSGWHVH
jgi:hypothetical protein